MVALVKIVLFDNLYAVNDSSYKNMDLGKKNVTCEVKFSIK